MTNLKRNSTALYLVAFFALGCTSVPFRVTNHTSNRVEINVMPNRVLLECEWIHDADIKGLYGFLMYVLDEENTVVTVAQTNTLGKEDCQERLSKIGKILKKGRLIYIGGMGNFDEPRTEEQRKYFFPELGTYSDNGRMLQFMVIANEFGECYSAYHRDEKPCPRNEFPITEQK